MSKSVSLRVRKEYFDLIVKGEKKVELRADSEYWRKRFGTDFICKNPPNCAVFLCGKAIHRREILRVTHETMDRLVLTLGREPSKQGIEDLQVGIHDHFYAIWLGDAVENSVSEETMGCTTGAH